MFKYIKSIEKELLDIAKNRLENESKDIFGKALGYYSKATEMFTEGRKQAGTPFTANDTGDFFKGFYMQEVSGVLRFGSKSPHWADIQKSKGVWLSKELFGLSDEELKEVIKTKLLPFILENARNKLGL